MDGNSLHRSSTHRNTYWGSVLCSLTAAVALTHIFTTFTASNLNFEHIVYKKGGSAKIAYVRDLKTLEKLSLLRKLNFYLWHSAPRDNSLFLCNAIILCTIIICDTQSSLSINDPAHCNYSVHVQQFLIFLIFIISLPSICTVLLDFILYLNSVLHRKNEKLSNLAKHCIFFIKALLSAFFVFYYFDRVLCPLFFY